MAPTVECYPDLSAAQIAFADDDARPAQAERLYLTHRAQSELAATMRATCMESEIVHNAMTRAYLLRCRDIALARTTECVSCLFQNVCDATEAPTRQ